MGNPDLAPETSQSFDIGASQALWRKRITLDVAYFSNVFKQAIDFEEGPPPRLVNRSETTAQGVEMSLRVQPWPTLGVTAHLTYMQTDIRGSSWRTAHRPVADYQSAGRTWAACFYGVLAEPAKFEAE